MVLNGPERVESERFYEVYEGELAPVLVRIGDWVRRAEAASPVAFFKLGDIGEPRRNANLHLPPRVSGAVGEYAVVHHARELGAVLPLHPVVEVASAALDRHHQAGPDHDLRAEVGVVVVGQPRVLEDLPPSLGEVA